jgi:hypothetical protein
MQQKKIREKSRIGISLALIMVLFIGCAFHQKTDGRRITNMMISKNPESLILTVEGNRALIYSAEKLVLPMGLVLQFPDTSLELSRRIYIPPENEIISSVKAVENIEGQTTTARILISFKKDTPYEMSADDGRLTITFPAAGALSEAAQPDRKTVEKKPEPEPEKKTRPAPVVHRRPAAKYLKTVTATTLEGKTTVEVKADGAIEDYKSFTLDRPPRIVFDLYNLKSPYKTEQTISVGSPWVKRIRHFAHPDKVRLVLETRKRYLSKYSAHAVDTGLLIDVGDTRTAAGKTNQSASDAVSGTRQAKLAWEEVPNADAYNVYWSASPGVNRHTGNKISNVHSPVVIKNLKSGATYYFVVTAVKGNQESHESEEISFTPGE